MKNLLTLLFLTFSFFSFSQRMTYDDWKNLSIENKRLLPKYGGLEKTVEENKSDQAFIADIMETFNSEEEASNHMIDLGFKYLYRGDLKTAMYRFNQAYLLENTNSNIHWGFGAIYMALGQYDLSKKQYQEGLKMNPKNDNILIDFATCYLGEFYQFFESNPNLAKEKLEIAIEKLHKAYKLNPKNANASYKLSICYMYSNDCENAIKFLDISEKLENPQITDSFRTELKQKCNSINLDCSTLKTGMFKTEDELSGVTLIERTNAYQIEENKKYNSKLKLEITWLDSCTYQLKPVADLLNPNSKDLPKFILTCEIIEITENGYMQISSTDSDPRKIAFEVQKIK